MKSFLRGFYAFASLVLIGGLTISQAQTPVERLVAGSGAAEASFQVEQARLASDFYDDYLSQYVVFDYDAEVSRRVAADRPEVIELTFPTSRGSYSLTLVRKDITSPDYRVESSDGSESFDGPVGIHYRGVVEGQPGSLAGASFYGDEVSIFASTPALGNVTANKTVIDGQARYISYFDRDLLIDPGFECATEDPEEVPELLQNIRLQESLLQQQRGSDVCVRVHFEADNGLYVNKGSVAATAAYIEAFFNVVSILYANESVNTVISYIHVWTTLDPFVIPAGGGSSNALNALGRYFETGANLNGDIGHLVAFDQPQGYGGVAYVGTLCLDEVLRVAYSDINSTYNPDFPNYSWTVMVVTHEMGHNLGSPHTHSCVWNGNATQIDDCGNVGSSTAGSCYQPLNPIIPEEDGGTIMSYCHFSTMPGINFTLGFGPQPGNVVRATINSASCLNACPIGDCSPPSQLIVSSVGETSAMVSWYHPEANDFEVIVSSDAGSDTIIVSGALTYELTGLDAGTKYRVRVTALCNDDDSDSVGEDFSTLCNTLYTLTYIELFEGTPWVVNSYELDACWQSTISPAGYGWVVGQNETGTENTGPSGDHTSGAGKYIYAESSYGTGSNDAELITPPIDLGSSEGPFVSFWYHMYGAGINRLQVHASDNDGATWSLLRTISGQQQASSEAPWQQAILSLADFEGETVRLRFTARRGLTVYGDIAIDDVIVTDSTLVDVSVSAMTSPVSDCGLGAAETVTVTLENTGYVTLTAGTAIGLDLTLNGNPVASEPLTLAADLEPGGEVAYSFTATLDLSVPEVYEVSIAAVLAADEVAGNNARTATVVNKPIIDSYPYTQGFEAGSDWTAGGTASSWALGTPDKSIITGASEGVNAWVTGGLGRSSYNANENSYVEGPCFDFSNLRDPHITMDVWWELEPFWEGAQFQYSTDQGETWQAVGDSAADWFNASYILTMLPDEGGMGWSGTIAAPDPQRPWLDGSGGWVTVSQDLSGLGLEPSVFLRMLIKTDPFVEFDGIAFDNIIIDGTPICHRIDLETTTCDPQEVGVEVEYLTDAAGCDSIVTVSTILVADNDIQIQLYSCNPADTGSVVDTYSNVYGCDSVVTTVTSLWPSYQYSLTVETCDPDEVDIEIFNLTTVNGCDSTVLVNTVLAEPYRVQIDGTTCIASQASVETDTLVALNGCDSIVTVSTLFDPVEAAFTYVLNGGTATFTNTSSNAVSYQWSFGDGNTNGVANPTNSYNTSGDYEVVLIASAPGCESDTETVVISVLISGIDQLAFLESVQVYPNPNSGNFALEISGEPVSRPMTLTLFSLTGAEIDSREVQYNTRVREQYALEGLAPGMYFLRIASDGEQATLKINVMR